MPRPTIAQLEAKLKAQIQLTHEVLAMKDAEIERMEEKMRRMKALHETEMTQVHLAHHREVSNLRSALHSYQRMERDEPRMGFFGRVRQGIATSKSEIF